MGSASETTRVAQPVRVLYIARAPFVSGAERALLTMLRHVDRSRAEPMLVLGHETAMADHAKALGVPFEVIRLAKRTPGEMLAWRRSVKQLKKVMRRFGPAVLHANDVPSSQAMSVVGAGRGLVRVAHVRWTISADEMGWWARRGVEQVICISDYIREQLGARQGTPVAKARVTVMHDAVDWAGSELAEEPPERRGRSGRATTLAFAGQLIESKGLDLVIRGMGKLNGSARPRLIVAGEDTQRGGAYRRELEDLAREVGVASNIEWRGFVEDVGTVYGEADAVVCPSREEPLGLIPLEAAAFALPAIANLTGGFRETIEDGETGLLVAPEVDAWAGALGRLGALDLRGMGEAAWARVRERHDPRLYMSRMHELYEALAGSR